MERKFVVDNQSNGGSKGIDQDMLGRERYAEQESRPDYSES